MEYSKLCTRVASRVAELRTWDLWKIRNNREMSKLDGTRPTIIHKIFEAYSGFHVK